MNHKRARGTKSSGLIAPCGLTCADLAEEPGDKAQTTGMSYTISPRATGPTVCGLFEGRSPCRRISRALNLPEEPGCIKVKWRVTLYQNPETSTPTTYKIEGSLHRQNPREGNWTILRGTKTDPNAILYRLEPTQTEAPLFLLKGDDNVLFFLDANHKPLIGDAEFSYTLNRVGKL